MAEKKKQENMLDVMTEKWMQLERKTIKQREAAEQFYEKKLMKLIEEDFIRRNAEKVFERIEYMILSVGTSYEPLVLNLQLLKPEKILGAEPVKNSALVCRKRLRFSGLSFR